MFRSRRRPVPVITSALAGALALGLALTGCSGSNQSHVSGSPKPVASPSGPPPGVKDPATQPQFSRFYDQTLTWSGCGDGFQCASMTVPIDWSQPAGPTLRVALAKLPAQKKKERLGSLVVNPGGPGVPGISYARAAKRAFGSAILDHYDIVGFDPRGVGGSDPVQCLPDSQLDAYVAEDGTPDDPAELARSVSESKRFAQACVQHSGELIRHVDTLSVVRDMDVLRAALGEGALTYHGASYGTYLGAWYAQTFPWRVGRMVLDGAVDPSLDSAHYVDGQAAGFSRALRSFVEDCESQSQCPLKGSLTDGLDQLGALVEASDSAPLQTSSGRRLTQALMVIGIAQGLYDDSLWPLLTIGIQNALHGDGSELLRLADTYLERDSNGHFGQTIAANPAIFCLDMPEKRTPQQIEADAQRVEAEFPPLGGSIAWGALGCSVWPIPAVMPHERLSARGAAPILVVGTVDDPATPYEWAQSLASQLTSGRLLTWEGTVHTAYHQGSKCIDSAVESYLVSGTLPAAGTRCK